MKTAYKFASAQSNSGGGTLLRAKVSGSRPAPALRSANPEVSIMDTPGLEDRIDFCMAG
jgi:hypothetical protein